MRIIRSKSLNSIALNRYETPLLFIAALLIMNALLEYSPQPILVIPP